MRLIFSSDVAVVEVRFQDGAGFRNPELGVHEAAFLKRSNGFVELYERR